MSHRNASGQRVGASHRGRVCEFEKRSACPTGRIGGRHGEGFAHSGNCGVCCCCCSRWSVHSAIRARRRGGRHRLLAPAWKTSREVAEPFVGRTLGIPNTLPGRRGCGAADECAGRRGYGAADELASGGSLRTANGGVDAGQFRAADGLSPIGLRRREFERGPESGQSVELMPIALVRSNELID